MAVPLRGVKAKGCAAEADLHNRLRAFMAGSGPAPGAAARFSDWPTAAQVMLDVMINAPTPMALFVGPQFHTFYNAACLGIFGSQLGDALGQVASDLPDIFCPQIATKLCHVRATGQALSHDACSLTPQSAAARHPFGPSFSLSPVGSDAKDIAAVLAVVSQVAPTDGRDHASNASVLMRPQNAQMLRRTAAVIEGSQDAILTVDLQMMITSWNQGAERLYGWKAADIVGSSVLRLLPEGRQDEEREILERIRKGERVNHYETTRLDRCGKEIPVSLAVSPIYDEAGDIIGASKIARNISQRLEAERMQRYLVFEMKHRVKNILATVLALARQTLGQADLPGYEVFASRITALSRSQDLLTQKGRSAVPLAALITEVLKPFASDSFSIEGPPLMIPGDAVLSVTLALHELVTNALKYGALSTPEGRVSIRWQIDDHETTPTPMVHLTWRETGGPLVSKPSRRGFGSVLIRDLLASVLRGEITLHFPPEGAQFAAHFPQHALERRDEAVMPVV